MFELEDSDATQTEPFLIAHCGTEHKARDRSYRPWSRPHNRRGNILVADGHVACAGHGAGPAEFRDRCL